MLVSVQISEKQVKFLDNLAKLKNTSRYQLLKDINAAAISQLEIKHPNIQPYVKQKPVMVSTNLLITEDQYKQLKKTSQTRKVSMSELVRGLIDNIQLNITENTTKTTTTDNKQSHISVDLPF